MTVTLTLITFSSATDRFGIESGS